ncbi:hypothetical protein [Rossellomorea sp. SC111]|nr:hypothetical protein [Rossellomorea sp. SC111]
MDGEQWSGNVWGGGGAKHGNWADSRDIKEIREVMWLICHVSLPVK